MLLREIYEGLQAKVLTEIMDFVNIKSYDFDKLNSYEYKFKTDDDSEVYIQFEEFVGDEIGEYFRFPETFGPKLKIVHNTAFSVDGIASQAKETDLKYSLPIWKTVTLINHEFVREKNPECITVFATSRTGIGVDAVKLKAWKLITKKHPPSGYYMTDCFHRETNEKGFCLYKNSLLSSKRNGR